MELRSTLLSILILLSFSSVVISDSDCTYIILVQTGTVPYAGTDATISLTLFDSTGHYIEISNLETWGTWSPVMTISRTVISTSSKQKACLPGPICMIQLISDNTGNEPGWFVNYVEVITIGPSSGADEQFMLNRWLALDEPPQTLEAIVDHCNGGGNDHILRHQVNTISPYKIGRLRSIV